MILGVSIFGAKSVYQMLGQRTGTPLSDEEMAKKLHAKRNAFCHRDFDAEFGHEGFGGGTGRGYRGKTALYIREFLVAPACSRKRARSALHTARGTCSAHSSASSSM